MIDLDLSGKTAIVCGSTQGIGRAIAIELAELGANILLIARNEDKLKLVAAELDTSSGQKHFYISADFNKPDILESKVKVFASQRDQVHILVNNTGGPAVGGAYESKTVDYQAAFNKHLICNQILVQTFVPLMKNAEYGRIINITSTSVKQVIPGLGISNTIRAAVANWAKTLSVELAEFGITVNNIMPGFTETQRITSIIDSKALSLGRSAEDIRNIMIREVPMKRFAQPEEIAHSVAFLASPAASYITGVTLAIDGGKTLSI